MKLSNIEAPPVFKGHWLLGNIPYFLRDPIQAFMQGWAQCGDVVHFRMFGPISFYLLAHPSDIKHVLQDNHDNYQKDPLHSAKLKSFAGQGLTMSEGSLWQQQSRLMRPAFRRSCQDSFLPSIMIPTEETLAEWQINSQRQRPIDISAEMLRLSLRIVMRSLFDVDPGDQATTIVQASTVVLEHAYRGMRTYYSLPSWLPFPSNRRFAEARRTLDELAYAIISQRRDSPTERKSLLSLLMNGVDDKKKLIPDKQIRDEIITMILAGHDTTAIALTWALYLLSHHPLVMKRMRAEALAALNTKIPIASALENLPYTEAVLNEALRLFPPAWVLSRISLDYDEIGGYLIPPGSTLFLSPFITHRHTDFWRDPEDFIPDRFNEELTTVHHQYAYFPFGGGPRQCIGRIFALTAAKLVLAMIVRDYTLSIAPNQRVRAKPKLTLHPENSILMNVEKAT